MKILVELTLDENWDEYQDTHPDIILEDAIRELADGVTYEFKEITL